MTFLKNALKTLPDDLRGEIKAKVGADAVVASTAAARSGSPPAVAAVTAVAAAAGHLVGGIWGGRRRSEKGRGRGLVRELVERCLFSLPHERGDGDEETDEV